MTDKLDAASPRSWIGRTAEATDVITPRLVDEFLATFSPHIGSAGTVAPLGIHWCLSPFAAAADALGPDGHPRTGGFLPPVPLPRRMWAGGEVELRGPLHAGDTVTRRSRIEDVAMKAGRSGPLCFVAVRHDYDAGRGVAISERHDIVYREGASGPTPPVHDLPAADPAGSDVTWRVTADPVLLFRYSALTFNGHRIHYDLPYAMGEEGYAGLVVHGPVQATLLLHMAAHLRQGVPARFSYRAQRPLIAGQAFAVRGTLSADGAMACWTETEDGSACMRASAPAQETA